MSPNTQVSPKVASGTLAGAVVAILVWIVHTVWDVDIPGAVGSALVVVVGAVLGYAIRDPRRDDTTGQEPDVGPDRE